LNISNPSQPTVISVWDSPNNDAVEGQDRINDLLVVCSIDQGGIYTFNISSSSSSSSSSLLTFLAYTDIPDAGSTLHVKLKHYKNSARTVAFLSQGWCENVQLMGCDRFGWTKVHIVDVTNATHPTVLGSISTSVLQPESLQVRGNYLYVGGIGSNVLAVLNITNPDAVQVLCSGGICSSHPHYNQMVGEVLHNGVDGSFHPVQEDDDNLLHRYWLAALWGTPGGLAVFDTLNPALPVPLHHVTDKTLSSANRVHVHNHYAIIPMEQDPAGGFAVLNVANTSCPPAMVGVHFLGVGKRPKTTTNVAATTTTTTTNDNSDDDAPPVSSRVYCLVAKDDHLILFVSWTCEMYSFNVPMIASKAHVLDCPSASFRPPPATNTNRISAETASTTVVTKTRKLAMGPFVSSWIGFVLLLLVVSAMLVNSCIPLGLLLW
jgi:LVIVD repeat